MDQQLDLIPPEALIPLPQRPAPSDGEGVEFDFSPSRHAGYRRVYRFGVFVGILPPRSHTMTRLQSWEFEANGWREEIIDG